MIDGNAVMAAREYLRENEFSGLQDHLNDIGFTVNAVQVKVIVTAMLKEDGYSETEIRKALETLE